MAYIREMGGSRSLECNQLARDLWLWARSRGIWVSCYHVSGILNAEADFHSRNFNPDTEWKLNPKIFDSLLQSTNFKVNVDLFASQQNYQLKPYVSFQPDPESMAVDAFSLNWSHYNGYIFFHLAYYREYFKSYRKTKPQHW